MAHRFVIGICCRPVCVAQATSAGLSISYVLAGLDNCPIRTTRPHRLGHVYVVDAVVTLRSDVGVSTVLYSLHALIPPLSAACGWLEIRNRNETVAASSSSNHGGKPLRICQSELRPDLEDLARLSQVSGPIGGLMGRFDRNGLSGAPQERISLNVFHAPRVAVMWRCEPLVTWDATGHENPVDARDHCARLLKDTQANAHTGLLRRIVLQHWLT